MTTSRKTHKPIKRVDSECDRNSAVTVSEIDEQAAADPDAQPTDEALWKDAHVAMPQPKQA